jgi:tetratricopeptide (TPR) repeat protein
LKEYCQIPINEVKNFLGRCSFLDDLSFDINIETNLKKIGNIIRRERKRRGLTQGQLADEHISTSTISSIELGLPNVHFEKIRYLSKKLNIDLLDYPTIIKEEEKRLEEFQQDLVLIEARLDLHCEKHAIQMLRNLDQQLSKRYSGIVDYLFGRYHFNQKNWEKAEKFFKRAIKHIKASPELKSTNIIAASYKELGRISFYYHNDLHSALHLTQKGIKTFVEDGERSELKFFLLIGKASYLEKQNELNTALRTINYLWKSLDQIDNLEIKLNLYEISATLHKRMGSYDMAIKYAKKGFKIAITNQKYERALEILTTWGNICTKIGDLKTAEKYYLMALELENKIKNKYLFVSTYTHLGKLYMKQKRWQEALQNLQKATEVGKTNTDKLRYTIALMTIGDYYLSQDLYSEALSNYQAAYELSIKHNFEQQDKLLALISECWKETGNEEKYIETLKELQVKLRGKVGD